jgi:hypothetical protein
VVHTATQPTEQRGTVTWYDLIEIQDSHGFRPVGKRERDGRPGPEAKALRDVYRQWVARCRYRGDGHLMPLSLLINLLPHFHPDLVPRHDWSLVVNAFNDPSGLLVIQRRPYAR